MRLESLLACPMRWTKSVAEALPGGVVGAVVVGVAILGFKRLAQFSEVCVPWLFVMLVSRSTVGVEQHLTDNNVLDYCCQVFRSFATVV